MAEIPPKWVLEKYAKLWVKFKATPFSLADANDLMADLTNPSVFYTQLRTTGWLKQEVDPEDGRKRINTLQDPKQMIEEIGQSNKRAQDIQAKNIQTKPRGRAPPTK